MKRRTSKLVCILICCALLIGMLPSLAFAAGGSQELNPQISYTGGGLTFEKISHVNTPLEQADGVVDYAGNGSVAIHDPNAETDLVGDRGQSYSYAAAAHGDWVYIGTMYGGLGAANIISGAMTSAGMDRETALAAVNTMYNGRLYISEPDGKNAGGIFFKFNVKTGETVMLLSKDLNGIIPTFRSAMEMNGKLYFVGMIQDVALMQGQPSVVMPAYYGIDMLNEAILYQNGLPVIYEVTPSDEAEGDVLTRIYDCVGGDLSVYRSMVQQNMFTSTRAIGQFRDSLIAGCMDANGPFLAASNNPSGGQETFHKIADLDDLFGYTAYKRSDATGGGGIYQVVEYAGKLYVAIVSGHASTLNPETGTMRSFSILRGEIAEGADPTVKENWTWSVLVGDPADGAKYPFGIDETRVSCVACTLQVYNGHLYIGDYNDVSSALQGFVSKQSFLTQYTNLEQSLNLYRMDESENLEMIVGDPNPTFPEGGISGWGSGYGSHMNQYHWQTTVYQGKMYLSTMDTTTLLSPIVQFTNGDILELTEEEWISQINYIRVLLELVGLTDGGNASLLSGKTAEQSVYAAIEKAQQRAEAAGTAKLNQLGGAGLSDLSSVELTEEQIQALVDFLQNGCTPDDQIPEELVEKLAQINNALDQMREMLEEKVSEEFLAMYSALLDELEALKDEMPESVDVLYGIILAYATEQNLQCLLASMPYFTTSVAGFDLYSLESFEDGSVSIELVSDNGFGDPNNHGLRVFTETDDYLVIGTANPFYGTQLWRTAGFTQPEPTPDPEPVIPPVILIPGSPEACSRDHNCPMSAFSDLDPMAWYHHGVHYCLKEGLMVGTGGDKFSPYLTTSRAMIWTILARIDGVDTATGSTWYEVGQKWAIEKGISDGTNPHSPITREQLVTMLYRYAGEPITFTAHLAGYADGDQVSSWAAEAMAWAVANGILVGNEGKLMPGADSTRVEAATILYRFCTKVK